MTWVTEYETFYSSEPLLLLLKKEETGPDPFWGSYPSLIRSSGSLILGRLSINEGDQACYKLNKEHSSELTDSFSWLGCYGDTSSLAMALSGSSSQSRTQGCAPHWPFKAHDLGQEQLQGLWVVTVAVQDLQEVTEGLDLGLRPPGRQLLRDLHGFWREVTLGRKNQSDTQDPAVSPRGQWAIPHTPALTLSHTLYKSGWHVPRAYCMPGISIHNLHTISLRVCPAWEVKQCHDSHLTDEDTQAGW